MFAKASGMIRWSSGYLGATLLLVVSAACSGDEAPLPKSGRRAYDTSPIDVTSFPADPEVTARVLRMPFGAAAARLGSLDFEARTYFSFSRGGDEVEQSDLMKVRQDSNGNFHVFVDTSTDRVELYLIDEDVYVREDKGHLRKKPRREVSTDTWTDLAWSSIQQNLDLFQPRLRFVDPQPESLGGRETMRYRLTLAAEGEGDEVRAPPPAPSSLPVAPPARWRELRKPLDVSGQIWVDAGTGVVLKVKLEGRLEIPDRDVRPTQLLVRYDAAVANVGKVETVKAAESVPEYRRAPGQGDPIGFFRGELPVEENPATAPTKPK